MDGINAAGIYAQQPTFTARESHGQSAATSPVTQKKDGEKKLVLGLVGAAVLGATAIAMHKTGKFEKIKNKLTSKSGKVAQEGVQEGTKANEKILSKHQEKIQKAAKEGGKKNNKKLFGWFEKRSTKNEALIANLETLETQKTKLQSNLSNAVKNGNTTKDIEKDLKKVTEKIDKKKSKIAANTQLQKEIADNIGKKGLDSDAKDAIKAFKKAQKKGTKAVGMQEEQIKKLEDAISSNEKRLKDKDLGLDEAAKKALKKENKTKQKEIKTIKENIERAKTTGDYSVLHTSNCDKKFKELEKLTKEYRSATDQAQKDKIQKKIERKLKVYNGYTEYAGDKTKHYLRQFESSTGFLQPV